MCPTILFATRRAGYMRRLEVTNDYLLDYADNELASLPNHWCDADNQVL